MTPSSRGVQSIEVGGRLLGVMAEAAQPLMLRDLAGRAALTPAQAHAYLTSFRKLGLVEQDADSGRYSLGPFALQLGLARLRSFAPLRAASRAAVELADALGLMVTVAVWGNFGATIVQVHESVDQVHVNLRAGTVFSLTGTATGRVFAACLPEAIVQPRIQAELREAATPQRVGRPVAAAQVAAQLADIRRLGYATTEGVPIPGINALSAPVFDHTGQVQTAITVIGPAAALSADADTPALRALLACTRRLSGELGHRPAQGDAAEPPPSVPAPGHVAGTARTHPAARSPAVADAARRS